MNTLNILVVDNERIIADTMALILRANGFQAEVAYSAEDALKRAQVVGPDLLLSEVMLGEMTGIELGTRFLTEHPNCRIMLCSGHGATTELLEAAEERGHSFSVLPKPIHPSELLLHLRS